MKTILLAALFLFPATAIGQTTYKGWVRHGGVTYHVVEVRSEVKQPAPDNWDRRRSGYYDSRYGKQSATVRPVYKTRTLYIPAK